MAPQAFDIKNREKMKHPSIYPEGETSRLFLCLSAFVLLTLLLHLFNRSKEATWGASMVVREIAQYYVLRNWIRTARRLQF